MSIELKVNTNIKTSIDLIKNSIVANLSEARGKGKFSISDRDFENLCNIVILSFDQGQSIAFKNIQSVVSEIKKEYGTNGN